MNIRTGDTSNGSQGYEATGGSLPSLASRLGAVILIVLVCAWTVWLLTDKMKINTLASADADGKASLLEAGLPARASAERYEAIADAALFLPEPDLALSREASLRALSLNPAHVTAWNRLAYLDYTENGMSEDVTALLNRSYAVAPYGGTEMMRWRVLFGAAAWRQLPVGLRASTLSQVNALSYDYGFQRSVREEFAALPTPLSIYGEQAANGFRARLDPADRCTAGTLSPLMDDRLAATVLERLAGSAPGASDSAPASSGAGAAVSSDRN